MIPNPSVITKLNAHDAVIHLRNIGEDEEANNIEQINIGKNLDMISWPWNREPKPWEHTSYGYGFISAKPSTSSQTIDICDARNIPFSKELQNSSILISLDYVRIFNYPGKGNHQVLLKYTTKNQLANTSDEACFNQVYNIQENEHAPISGYPIFVGLSLKKDPLVLECEIVNVKNDDDERLLSFINSTTFNDGMKLLNQTNPVMPIISNYAIGITKMLATRNSNVFIPAPKLGLYFSTIPTQIKLAIGSYIAVQMPNPGDFDWTKWKFNKNTGTIQSTEGPKMDIPFNYFVFSVNKY